MHLLIELCAPAYTAVHVYTRAVPAVLEIIDSLFTKSSSQLQYSTKFKVQFFVSRVHFKQQLHQTLERLSLKFSPTSQGSAPLRHPQSAVHML